MTTGKIQVFGEPWKDERDAEIASLRAEVERLKEDVARWASDDLKKWQASEAMLKASEERAEKAEATSRAYLDRVTEIHNLIGTEGSTLAVNAVRGMVAKLAAVEKERDELARNLGAALSGDNQLRAMLRDMALEKSEKQRDSALTLLREMRAAVENADDDHLTALIAKADEVLK